MVDQVIKGCRLIRVQQLIEKNNALRKDNKQTNIKLLISFDEIINLIVEDEREEKRNEQAWKNGVVGAEFSWDKDQICDIPPRENYST